MLKIPTLQTPRLILRPFKLEEAAIVAELANDKDIATNTENLPYPYEEYMAYNWITHHEEMFIRGDLLNLCVALRKTNQVLGAIGFDLDYKNNNAELGYWLGRPFWGQGYATEAARRMLHYGFTELKFHRIHSCHLTLNPASGNILKKIGMQHEGHLREHLKKWDKYEDLEKYAILKSDYEKA